MSRNAAEWLSPLERETLAGIADVMIPAWQAMPSASEIGLAGDPVDAALRARSDLVAPMRKILGESRSKAPGDVVRALAASDPCQFQVLMQAVTGAYYMHPTVRQLLGYGGQRRLSID